MFAGWGRFVYRFRWATLVVSILLLGLSIFGAATGGPLAANGAFGANLPAGTTAKLISDELGAQQTQSVASATLIFSSTTLKATEPQFKSDVLAALAPLQNDSRVTDIKTPYSVPPPVAASFISKDSHMALVVIDLKDSSSVAQKYINQLVAQVHPAPLSMMVTGFVPINLAFNDTLEQDLQRAEYVALPITLVMLLLIFASVVAALLPLSVGILTIVGGVGGTLFLAHVTNVSQYAMNIITLIGLAVAIDYSLFVVNRFRDELALGASREDALATTMATAGRAITFSGVTVAIGLSAMLFYQGTFLASMGAAGAIVVGVAVLYGLTFLPAVLAVLGGRVDRLRMPFLKPRNPHGTGGWHAMAMWVMRRPVTVLLPALAILFLAGTPFFQLRLANGDVDQLPPDNAARQGYDIMVADFPGQDQTLIQAVAYYPGGSAQAHISDTYVLSTQLASLPNVLRVQGGGMGGHISVINLYTNQQYTTDAARNIVKAVRAAHVPDGQVLATGTTAYDLDIVNFILDRTPIAVGTVILVTYLVLFLLTGSVVLPFKAVVTNLFSISASFGAMVWIFQEGHLQHLLNFSPQAIDPSIPVILFSIVFGMSMDYEVLLISRIQEEYRRTHDNVAAVALGLEKSGRLITGAAAIMVAVFLAFGLANVVIIKAIGIGLAIAVAIDATIVRLLIVPSLMRILGDINWWAPHPLTRLHKRIGAQAQSR